MNIHMPFCVTTLADRTVTDSGTGLRPRGIKDGYERALLFYLSSLSLACTGEQRGGLTHAQVRGEAISVKWDKSAERCTNEHRGGGREGGSRTAGVRAGVRGFSKPGWEEDLCKAKPR